MITIYGLPNCDSTRLVLKKLKAENFEFDFVDLKKQALDKNKVKYWAKKLGLEKILNRQSTTWRSLGDEQQSLASELKTAIKLMVDYPTLIKRPILEKEGNVFCGIKEPELSKFLNQ